MASASLRQEVLDQLYNVLQDPIHYGDKFLLQITKTPKDGLVSVNLLYNMAKVLNPYPLEYIQHCIPLDSKQRFKWNSDTSRVGLKENSCYFETDAYGFSSDMSENKQDITEARTRHKVMPVVYENGRFYIDNEHSRLKGQNVKKCLYKYERLDVDPLGPKKHEDTSICSIDERTCFNCGKPGHTVNDCPLPHDKHQISKRRRETSEYYKETKRIHEWIDIKLKIDAFRPGVLSKTLQEALNITMPPDEPPYYAKMRSEGYPPGYLGYAYEKEEAPLQTYQNETDYMRAAETMEKQNKDTLVELVEYPGLQFVNTRKLDQYFNQNLDKAYLQSQNDQEHQLQQHYWDYYNYTLQQVPYDSSTTTQIDHPPGTVQTEYTPPETVQTAYPPPGTVQTDYLPPDSLQTYRSLRNIETNNTSSSEAIAHSRLTGDTLIEDNQSVDMDISSDDEQLVQG